MTLPVRQTRGLVVGLNDLETTDPLLASEMAPTGNGGLGPKDFTRGSNQKVNWVCKLGHQWVACINDRSSRTHGCPFCCGSRAWPGYNDLKTLFPDLAQQLVDTRFSAEDLTAKSNRRVKWRCALSHEWETTVSARTGGTGCPTCCGKKALPGFNSLGTIYPELAKELVDPTVADTHTSMSNKKVMWVCPTGHTWGANISDRVRGNGCRMCSISNTSKVEQVLVESIGSIFPHVSLSAGRRLRIDYGEKTYMVPDILLQTMNTKVVLEYDGSYWHKNKMNIDTEKTKSLLDAGYLVVRIREQCRGQILAMLPITHPNLFQVSTEYTIDSSHIRSLIPTIDAWITPRLT